MTKKIAEGDPVRVVEREVTATDTKSGLYYPHFQDLTGTIFKLYDDGTATVTVDAESLPPDLRKRHEAGTNAQRQKWLDGLSDEARNRLSAAEKKFSLRYTILVATADLVPSGAPRAVPPPVAKPTPVAAAQPTLDIDAEPPRKSLADLEAEEQRHLDEVSRKGKGA